MAKQIPAEQVSPFEPIRQNKPPISSGSSSHSDKPEEKKTDAKIMLPYTPSQISSALSSSSEQEEVKYEATLEPVRRGLQKNEGEKMQIPETPMDISSWSSLGASSDSKGSVPAIEE